MTEIELHNHPRQAAPLPAPADPTGGRLIAWAEGLQAAHRIGSALCQTAFVPASFRGKPEEAAAAILYGDEIGLTPTQALQSVHVISGKPGLYARTMVAIALSRGHEVWTVEKTDAKVTVAGRRKGSTHIHEETWTTARAQKAGYTSNRKYASDPQSMLYARAASDVVRQIAPDALAGLDYSVEEIELSESPAVTVTRSPQPARRAQRKQQQAAVAEPDLEPTPAASPATPADTEPVDAVPLRTEAQSRKLWALARERGLDADGFKDYVRQELGRPLESTKEITKAEAGALIDQLEALDPATGEVHDAEVIGGTNPPEGEQ